MGRYYLDTSFLITFLLADQINHDKAVSIRLSKTDLGQFSGVLK